MSRLLGGLAVLLLSISTVTSGQAGLPSTAKGDWTYYNADIKGTKYSPLDQINASNFGKLEIAWRFKTDMLGRQAVGQSGRQEITPACLTA